MGKPIQHSSNGKGKITYGSGMKISRSYRVTLSFSSSYSMLTSQVPSFEGVGQQLTGNIIRMLLKMGDSETHSRAALRLRRFPCTAI